MIGGGAAGIIAAWRAASIGASVVILEKTVRLGTKILISGGGKCNITHDGPIEDVLKAFRANEARFLRPSFYRFQAHELVKLLTDRGLEVYTRPDGRIFPVHQNAKDVVAILRQLLDEVGVQVRFECPVQEILTSEGRVTGLRTPGGILKTSKVVLCVGGSSYPNSGTTGDGWPWMKQLGHTIVPLRAALAPIYIALESESPSGLSLRDVILKARLGTKEIDRWRGDMLFTHQGLSGPCALGISRNVAEKSLEGPVAMSVDLLPDRTFDQLLADLVADAVAHPHRSVGNHLGILFPDRVVELVLKAAGGSEGTRLKDWDRKSRNRVVETLKSLPLGMVRAVPLEKGEVVAGGVSLNEVNPQTMESRNIYGAFLCGEILDIAGPVGGYNLQAAWSTGFVAGETAAMQALSRVE